MSVDEGLFVKHEAKLGRRKYQNLSSHYENSVSVKHPSPQKLSAREKELIPELSEVEHGGVWANVSELAQRSIQETINHLVDPEKLREVGLDNITGR